MLNKKYNLKDVYENPENHSDLLFHPGYLIYKITNTINNKCYIGDTKSNLEYRLFTAWHGTHFSGYENSNNNVHLYNSMRKY